MTYFRMRIGPGEDNQKSRLSVGIILTTLVMLLAFCALMLVVAWRRQTIPTEEGQHREQRLKTLAELNAENNKILASYRWVDKQRGMVGIPIERAIELELLDLRSNKPHPAGPLAAPTPAATPASKNRRPVELELWERRKRRLRLPAIRTPVKSVFLQCAACHSLEADVNKTGPSLAGLFGRKAGSVEDFNYSDANKNSGIVWDDAILRKYLPDPQKLVPGTKMAFPGLKDPKQVEDVIAYLKEATKK